MKAARSQHRQAQPLPGRSKGRGGQRWQAYNASPLCNKSGEATTSVRSVVLDHGPALSSNGTSVESWGRCCCFCCGFGLFQGFETHNTAQRESPCTARRGLASSKWICSQTCSHVRLESGLVALSVGCGSCLGEFVLCNVVESAFTSR